MRKMKYSGVEWIGEIPEDWEIICVRHLFRIGRGRVIAQTELKEDGEFPVYSSQTMSDGCLGYLDTYDFDADQLTWTTDGANAGTVFLRRGKYNCTNVCGTLLPCSPKIEIRYQKYSLEYISFYHKRADTNGYKIMNNEMAAIKTIVPPIDTQRRIADFLDDKCGKIDRYIEKQQQIIDKLKEYKQAVITEAVTKGLNPDVPMKDSGIEWIGMIPEHWEVTKIGNLFYFIGGYAFNSENYVSETNNVIVRIGNVKNDRLLLDANPVYISDEMAATVEKFKLKENDILFTMTGTKGKRDYFYTLMLSTSDICDKQLFLNQRVGCFRKKIEICPSYYDYLFKDTKILDSIFIYETGTANQGNLGIDSISRTKVHFPPLSEQIEIAQYLESKCSEIDSAIAKQTNIIEKLTEYKKSLIYEAVTGKQEV